MTPKKPANLKPALFLWLLGFLLFQLGWPTIAAAGGPVSVSYVPDGDTIILTDGRHVRYIGIDSPEIDHERNRAQPLGYAARQYNQELTAEPVWLHFDQQSHDRYGRLLAYVFAKADRSVFCNQQLLQKGYAVYLFKAPNIRYHKRLLKAQRTAMQTQKGLWRHWTAKKRPFVGNRRSRRFHAPNCRFGRRIHDHHRVVFDASRQAFWQGYAPCRNCLQMAEGCLKIKRSP